VISLGGDVLLERAETGRLRSVLNSAEELEAESAACKYREYNISVGASERLIRTDQPIAVTLTGW
jgi:hypothetical protein